MNGTLLGFFFVLCGAAFFVQGRMWQERAAGPGITRVWKGVPSRLRHLFRHSDGPLMIGPLPTQLWGIAASIVGALMILGLIPSGRPAALAIYAIFGLGGVVLGLLTLLTRFLSRDRS